jgi:hypothetical protein
MKCASTLSSVIVFCLVACDTMTGPISSGDFDPLRPPGSESRSTLTSGVVFRPGQFVRSIMDNTAFFKVRPKGDADADKLLKRGTSMKVISHKDSYVKVELDSGEVGFVPTVMVEDPNAVQGIPVTNPGEYQVYPPPGGSDQIPAFDPAGQPPGGAIPTVIDPEAPVPNQPVPPVTPTTDTFPTPPPPKTESAPLPPNDEDLKAKAPKVQPKLEE